MKKGDNLDSVNLIENKANLNRKKESIDVDWGELCENLLESYFTNQALSSVVQCETFFINLTDFGKVFIYWNKKLCDQSDE